MRAVGTVAILTAAVVALVLLQRSTTVYPPARTAHWINTPSNLRQMDAAIGLEVLAVAPTTSIWLGASTQSQPVNGCDWWYRLEVEVRKAGEPFTFEPTHFGEWIPRQVSRQPLTYPLVHVSDLEPGTRYRWMARERVQPFTEFSSEDGQIRCEPGVLRDSEWRWHHVPFEFSFRTAAQD